MTAPANRLRLTKIRTRDQWDQKYLGKHVWIGHNYDGSIVYYLCHRSDMLSVCLTDVVDVPDGCKTLYVVWTPEPVDGYVNGQLTECGGVRVYLDGDVLRPALMAAFEHACEVRYDNGMRYVHVEFEEPSNA